MNCYEDPPQFFNGVKMLILTFEEFPNEYKIRS